MRIRPLLAVVLALCLAFFTTACSGDSDAVQRGGSNVTYDDIHNTGKANELPHDRGFSPGLDSSDGRWQLRAA